MVLFYEYGQDTRRLNVPRKIEYKARHRDPVSCPKNIGLTRGVELCALIRSATTWLIAPISHQIQDTTPERGTGHKIVTSGALLDNTSETVWQKSLVGDADTSTV